jgi:hypothetical protein
MRPWAARHELFAEDLSRVNRWKPIFVGHSHIAFVPFGSARRVVQAGSFMGFIFPNLPLSLLPVLNCPPVLAASLLVQFILNPAV